MASIKNAVVHFPGNQGKVNNIITACGNLGGALFNYLMNVLIQLKKQYGEGYYEYDIAKNYTKYLYTQIGMVMEATLLAMCLMWKKSERPNQSITGSTINKIIPENEGMIETLTGEDERIEPAMKCNTSFEVEEPEQDLNQSFVSVKETKDVYHRNVKAAIFSSRTFLLFMIFLLTTFETNTITITYFPFGLKNKRDTNDLSMGAVIGSLTSCIIGPCWGFLYDILGFRIIIVLVNICCAANGVIFYWFRKITVLYLTSAIVNTCITGGAYDLLFPQIMKVFTHKYATEIYGIIVFSTGVSGMLTSVYIFVITYVFQVESDLAYLTVYMIGLALFVSMFETSEPFAYPEKEEGDDSGDFKNQL